MEEREEFHNRIEELQAHEEHMSDAVVTTEFAELSREYEGGKRTSASVDRELD